MRPNDNTTLEGFEREERKIEMGRRKKERKTKRGYERLEGRVGSLGNGDGVVLTLHHDGNRAHGTTGKSVTS